MRIERVLAGMFFLLLTAQTLLAHDHSQKEGTKPSKDSIFNLKSKWTDQNKKSVGLEFLKGQPSVVAMAYTSCQYSCPLIVEQMKKIETGLSTTLKGRVRFVFFSFDPKKDTPEKLREFASARKLDLKSWTLLNGSSSAVRDLAAVLGIRYKQDSQGDFDHSNVITLLDSEGVIRLQQTGFDQEPEAFAKRVSELLK